MPAQSLSGRVHLENQNKKGTEWQKNNFHYISASEFTKKNDKREQTNKTV